MCRSRDLVGPCCRVGLAGVGQVAAVAVLGFVLLNGVSGYFLIDATQSRTAIRTELRTELRTAIKAKALARGAIGRSLVGSAGSCPIGRISRVGDVRWSRSGIPIVAAAGANDQ